MSFLRNTCYECGGIMITLTSQNLLLCADCKCSRDFMLKPNQPSVLIEGLKGNERESHIPR